MFENKGEILDEAKKVAEKFTSNAYDRLELEIDITRMVEVAYLLGMQQIYKALEESNGLR